MTVRQFLRNVSARDYLRYKLFLVMEAEDEVEEVIKADFYAAQTAYQIYCLHKTVAAMLGGNLPTLDIKDFLLPKVKYDRRGKTRFTRRTRGSRATREFHWTEEQRKEWATYSSKMKWLAPFGLLDKINPPKLEDADGTGATNPENGSPGGEHGPGATGDDEAPREPQP